MSPVREAAPPWQVLIGPFAAEHVEAELEQGGPLLLIPNNIERAAELAEQFQGRGDGRLYFSRELLGAEDREVCWYRYNDPRFDGVSAPEELLHRAPNLRLRDLQLRPVVRLDSLIHGWANHDPALAALVSAGGGRIWLQSKLPAPIVAGVSRVIEVIREFCWTPLGSPADAAEGEPELATVAAWLERSCFRPAERRRVSDHSAALSLVWSQDPLRLSESRQELQAAEIARLRQESASLRQESTTLRSEIEAQRLQLEARQVELAAAQAELAALAEARRQLEQLAEQRGEQVERAAGENGSLRQECEALQAQLEALREANQQLEALAQQRTAEVAQLTGGHEAELARLRQEGEELRGRLAEAVTEIDAIAALLATPEDGVSQD